MSDPASSNLDLDVTLRTYAPGAKLFDRYILERVLGRGRKGDVWLAKDERLGMDVALKLLINYPHFHSLRSNIGSLLDLTHPNILRVYDFVGDENMAGFIMEYFPSKPLSEMLREKNGRPFEPSEISRWTRDLFSALHYAWDSNKVLHRDLRPAVLLVNDAGQLKVSDFGLAPDRAFDAEGSDPTSTAVVSLPCLSPQIIDGQPPTHSDDLYAAGASLYELLTTRPVFPGGNIILQIQRKVPPSIADRRKELDVKGDPVPKPWEQWMAKLLEKEPAKRPQSAEELVEWLRGAKSGYSTTTRNNMLTGAVSKALGSSNAAEAKKWLLKAAAFVIVAGAAVWGFLIRPANQTLTERRAVVARLDEAEKADKAVPADLSKAWQDEFITPFDELGVPFTDADEGMMKHALERLEYWKKKNIELVTEQRIKLLQDEKKTESLQNAVSSLVKDDKDIDSVTLSANEKADKINAQLKAWDELLAKYDVADKPTLPDYADEITRAQKARAALDTMAKNITATATKWVETQKIAVDALAAYCLTPDMSANKKLERITSLLAELQPDKAPPGTQAALPDLVKEVTAMKTSWEEKLLAEVGAAPATSLDELFKDTHYQNASQEVKGEVLRRMQASWTLAGITYDEKEAGKPGPSTHAGLVAWQKKHDIIASGRFSNKTLETAKLEQLDIFELEGEIAKAAALAEAEAKKKAATSKKTYSKKKVPVEEPSKWRKVGEFFKRPFTK